MVPLGLRQRGRLAYPLAAILVATVLGIAAFARPSVAAEPALIRSAGFAESDVGYVVFDRQTGQMVESHRPHKAFIPASLVKIATALAALEVLGPDHRFRTSVLARPLGEGLHLHLSGGGDPVFVQEDLSALAAGLVAKAAGRPVVRFTYDEALLPAIPQIDPSDDGLKPYNPPVSALSVNFNRQSLRWFRDEESRALRVMLRPDLDYAGAGVAAVRPEDGRSIRVVEGLRTLYLLDPKVPSAGQRQVAVRQPALHTAALLRLYAGRRGLVLPEPERLPVPPAGFTPLAVHESRQLLEIAQGMLEYSNNLSAELVGLATARALRGDVPSLAASAAIVQDWLAQRVPQINTQAETRAGDRALAFQNLSGLSGAARATPASMLALLRYGGEQRYATPPELLSEAGAERAAVQPFLSLLREIPWGRNDPDIQLFSKSGTMFYTRGQAGMVRGASGRELLFVLMITDFEARQRFESSPKRFTRPVQMAARGWLDRARRLERSVLLHWIATH